MSAPRENPSAIPPEPPARQPAMLAVILLIGVGAALRLSAAFDQFWLDEIWSLRNALRLRSVVEILSRLHTDNNHPLNTLILYWIGDTNNWFLYRLPSVAAGIASLVVFHRVAAIRLTGVASLAALVLMTASYPMIVYSSEARGYAPAILFSLLSFHLLERRRESGGAWRLGLFQVALVLGFLSHLTFAYVAVALFAASVAEQRGRGFATAVATLSRTYLLPSLVVAALYAPYVLNLHRGGGPEASAPVILLRFAGLLVGAPAEGWLGFASSLLAMSLIASGTWLSARRGDRDRVFYCVVILLPTVHVLLARPPVVFVRYLLVAYPFVLLLIVATLDRMFARPGRMRSGFLAAVALIVISHLVQVGKLLTVGRGHYLEAVRIIAANSLEPTLTVTSDQDFGNSLVLEFYERFLPAGRSIRYVPNEAAERETPGWLLLHRFGGWPVVPDRVIVGPRAYQLLHHSPYFGELSGFHWYVYRLVANEPPSATSPPG